MTQSRSLISLKSYLEEGRDASLYHGTSIMAFHDIITYGLHPLTQHNKRLMTLNNKDKYDEIKGVSMTRNLRFAQYFMEHKTHVIIEFDQRKLTQRYKLIPINFFNGTSKPERKEMEEFLVFQKPFNITPYVKSLICNEIYVYNSLKNKYGFPISFRPTG